MARSVAPVLCSLTIACASGAPTSTAPVAAGDATDARQPATVEPAAVAPGPEVVGMVRTCSVPPFPAPGDVIVDKDLVYADARGRPMRLDLFRPRVVEKRPGVLVFFGGGWKMGGKEHVRRIAQLLASQGYVAAAPDYRLAPEHPFPAQLEDARCALAWLAARPEVTSDRIAALGLSAGAHLATLLAVAGDVEIGGLPCARAGSAPPVVLAVAYYAPQDVRARSEFTSASPELVEVLLGGPPGDKERLAALASPIVHADRGDAPVLLVHGDRDELVPIGESRKMARALRAAGVATTLVELPGAAHSFAPFDDAPKHKAGACTTLAALAARLR